jgi:hypothetical protein
MNFINSTLGIPCILSQHTGIMNAVNFRSRRSRQAYSAQSPMGWTIRIRRRDGYASPAEAMASLRRSCICRGLAGIQQRTLQASILIRRPNVRANRASTADDRGRDELHHFGWNACGVSRRETGRYLIVPGLVSSRIHHRRLIQAADNAQGDRAAEVIEKTITAPHTVHCRAMGGS